MKRDGFGARVRRERMVLKFLNDRLPQWPLASTSQIAVDAWAAEVGAYIEGVDLLQLHEELRSVGQALSADTYREPSTRPEREAAKDTQMRDSLCRLAEILRPVTT
jgi:hypothetical protein